MTELVTRDVRYAHNGEKMLGYLCAPVGASALPGVLLIHDAFGLSADTIDIAHRLAGLGYAVFAADVWGNRTVPANEIEIGPLIGAMVSDRPTLLARIAAAHAATAELPEIDPAELIVLGHCFGGSSALEYVRRRGDVRGAISIHGGLDLLDGDWSAAKSSAQVLVCTGAEDPMATASMLAELESAMTTAGVGWETYLYSGTKHGFSNPKSQLSPLPDIFAYHPQSAARAWTATTHFLRELLPT